MDEDEDEMLETHKEVLEETDGAISIACSGPTNVDAATAFNKLLFKCQGPTCKAEDLDLLNLLMPTLVDQKLLDYCHACYKDHIKKDIPNEAFRLRV